MQLAAGRITRCPKLGQACGQRDGKRPISGCAAFLFEAFFGRFPRVDRATEASGCWVSQAFLVEYFYARRRSFRSPPVARARPKNAKPFQRVPVTATAIALSDE